jgi:hypothetical protein
MWQDTPPFGLFLAGVMWGLGQHMSETIDPFPIRTQPGWLWLPLPMPRLLAELNGNLPISKLSTLTFYNHPNNKLECQFVRNASSAPPVSRWGPA